MEQRVNPEVPIAQEATLMNGMTNQQLSAFPVWRDVAPRWAEFLQASRLQRRLPACRPAQPQPPATLSLAPSWASTCPCLCPCPNPSLAPALVITQGCDLAGYNLKRFDVPLLTNEFRRAGLDFSAQGAHLIDCYQIFVLKHPRTLRAAYQAYCGKPLVGAHAAMVDARATLEVRSLRRLRAPPDCCWGGSPLLCACTRQRGRMYGWCIKDGAGCGGWRLTPDAW